MNITISPWRKFWMNEGGQLAIPMAILMTALLGLSGIAVESGHAYYAYRQLVASTNAAALAGAQAMPDTTQATANVNLYSSATVNGVVGKNASPLLVGAQVTPTFMCLTTVTTTFKAPCETSTGGSGGSNAVKVTQTASVSSWFAGMFGMKTFNLSYTALAAMRGGSATNWNIAIVLDTTKSMSDPDSGKQCSGTQISCAIQGVQALLDDLYPCGLGQTCSSSSTYVDDVALYVFPPVLSSTAVKDYCSGSSGTPTHEYYKVPTLPTSGTPAVPIWTYQIISYSNNYKTTDSANSLNTASNIVAATGYSGTSCTGITAPGGAGTYYAQVIYQAQSDLATQAANNPGSKNAMIILTDGNATATYTSGSSSSDLQASTSGSLNGITGNNPHSYTYPSAVGECGQAVVAAQNAATSGTAVYTIGYGSPTSGCTSDATYSWSGTTNGGSWGPGDSPCQALAAMASAESNFFSDDGDGCKATVPSNASITTLTSIFHQITASMTTPRLIPVGTT